MKQPKTMTHEDQLDRKSTYIVQGCPACDVNHDYNLRGRTITCLCGAQLREHPEKRHRLVRVG